MVDSYGHRAVALDTADDPRNPPAVANQSQPAAILPLVEVASPVTGKRGVSLPFADFCTTVAPDAPSALRLQQAALREGQARNWKYLEFRGPCDLPGATPSLEFLAHIVDLTGGPEKILARCESSIRRAIRKADQANLTVSAGGTPADMRVFYALHCRTRKRHGLPPQPMKFFENIVRHIFEIRAGFAVIARLGERPVAASIFFRHGREAIYKYGASDFAFQHLRPSNLVMWEGIQACAGQGSEYLHLGRTSVANEGLRRFKLGYGAREEKLSYYRYNYKQAAFVTDIDRAETWANKVFGLMPIPLLRLCGRLIYPHLS